MQEIPDVENIEKHLIVLQERKDRVMEASRDVVRMAGKAITLMHAQKLAEAGAGVKKLRLRVEELKRLEKGFEYNSMQAHQEYVEALAFYVVLKEHRLVSLRETRVAEIAYLLGIMDLVGELKREAVDALREGRMDSAEMYYDFMKSIYDSTRAMRFASALVPDFRRKQDTARIQIESIASELASFESRHKRV
jgi:translin